MHNWFAGAAAGLLGVFGGFGAHNGSTTPKHNDDLRGTTTRPALHETGRRASTTPAVDMACVGQAVAAREASLGTAMTTYTAAVNAAYGARATALASAYAQSGNDAIRTAVKNAWTQFTGATRAAKKGWQSSKETAWQNFRSAIKSCGPAAATIVDSANATAEMSGQ